MELLLNLLLLNLTVSNVYLNTSDYTEKMKQMSKCLSKLDTEQSIVLTGESNAFSHDPRNTSSALRGKDGRVKRFAELQAVTENFFTAIELDVLDFPHYDKRISSFSRIDFFTNQNHFTKLKLHPSNFSDHKLELSNKIEGTDWSQSFCKLSDAVFCKTKSTSNKNRSTWNYLFDTWELWRIEVPHTWYLHA